MIRQIAWKEWRENRWKYITLYLVFNAPVLLIAFLIGVSRTVRTPFADLNNQTVMKYLPITLVETFLVVSIFLLVTGFVAIATFLPEIEHKTVFFMFEQPISRTKYVAAKLLTSGFHVVLAVCFAILFAPALVYGMMLMSGKVTIAGSGAAFGAVFFAAARSLLWCSLVSLAAFAGSALISAVVPRWWLATGCAVVFIALLSNFVQGSSPLVGGGSFFEIIPEIQGKTFSISASAGTAQWLTVSDVLPTPTGFAHWHWLPVLAGTTFFGLLAAGLALTYQRKEMK